MRPPTAKALEERLRHPDETVWTEASASLGLLACRSPRARQRLLALAESPSALWRVKSLPGLGQLSVAHPAGLAALMRLSEDPDVRVREGAARAIGNPAGASAQAWDALVGFAGSGDPALRSGAAAGLGECARERPAAVKHLEALAADPHGPVRASAVLAVAEAARAGVRGANNLLRRLCARAEADEHVCQAMARGLAGLLRTSAAAAMRLVQALARSPSEPARWCAAAALSGLPEKAQSGKAVAIRLSRDPSALVRTRLAQSLGESAPPWAQRILSRLTGDPDRFVSATAADALGYFSSSTEVLNTLLNLAASRQEHLRAAAAHALAKAAHKPKALKALEALAHDARSTVRQAVATALAAAPADARADTARLSRALAADPEPRVRAAVARGLDEPEGQEMLLSLAQDQSPAVRLATTAALARLGHRERSLGALCDLLCDAHCREPAATALADLLEQNPGRLTFVLRSISPGSEPEPALSALASACRDETIGQALRGWNLLLREPDLALAARLARERFAGCELPACREFASFARLVERACSARDVSGVAASQQAVSSLAKSQFLSQAGDSPWVLLLNCVRSAALAGRSRGTAEESAHLASATVALEQAYAEAADLQPLPRRILGGICAAWQQALHAAQSDAAERADIRVSLISGSVVRRPVVEITVLVENAGEASARDVSLEFTSGRGLTPAQTDIKLGELEPGAPAEASVSARCASSISAGQLRVTAHWRDSQRRRRSFSLPITLQSARRRFAPIPNPYSPGKPLDPDSPVFFGRQDVFDRIRDSLRGAHQCNVVGLIGQRRTGKTSIAKRLRSALGDAYLPILVDVQGLLVDSLPLLYYKVASAAADALRSQDIVMDAPDRDDTKEPLFLERYISEAAKRAGGRRLLIVLDEFDDLEPKVRSGLLPDGLFSYLRHLMQHVPHVAFLLCGTHRVEELDPRYWSTLFNLAIYQRLGPLDDASARDLASKPLEKANVVIEDMAVEKILRLCGGQPYLLQIAGHCLVAHMNEARRTAITSEDIDSVVPRIVSSAAGHLQYLWQLASPEEQAVLLCLAKRWPHQPWVKPDDIRQDTCGMGQRVDQSALDASLRSLFEKDLVHFAGRPPVRWCLGIGLLALWASAGDVGM